MNAAQHARGDARVALLRTALVVAGALVVVAGLCAELIERAMGRPLALTSRFSLSYETNVPTWYSTILLFSCALALAALTQKPSDGRARTEWRLLAALFAVMSLDEAAGLHELFNDTRALGGVFFYAWVVPGIAFVVLAAVRFLPFVATREPTLRRRIVIAGALYVGGALGMELVLGAWTDAYGQLGIGYALIDWTEESLEIAGASVFLWALVDEWARTASAVRASSAL